MMIIAIEQVRPFHKTGKEADLQQMIRCKQSTIPAATSFKTIDDVIQVEPRKLTILVWLAVQR